jgi:CRP/FNR family transcriptional regulator, cyclic AMP receptor protein
MDIHRWAIGVAKNERVMARVTFFQKLSEHELAQITAISKRHKFNRDHVVFFEGSHSDSLYVIVSGSVKIYQKAQDGREKILCLLGPGEFFGEFSLVDGQPRSASVATLQPTEMLSMAHFDFLRFAKGSPDVIWKVSEAMCERLRAVNEENFDLAFRNISYRFVRALLKLSEYGTSTAGGVTIVISKQELAAMVGSSPERVTDLLQKLAERRLVHTDGDNIHIPDINALRKALELTEDL